MLNLKAQDNHIVQYFATVSFRIHLNTLLNQFLTFSQAFQAI